VVALSVASRPPTAKAANDINAYTQLIQNPAHKAALAEPDVLLLFGVVLTNLGKRQSRAGGVADRRAQRCPARLGFSSPRKTWLTCKLVCLCR